MFSGSNRKKQLDASVLKNESEKKIGEIKKLDDIGKKFEEDKFRIEKMLEQIDASELDAKEREQQIRILKQERERLKQKYESDVAEKQEKLNKEVKEDIEGLEEVASKLEEQENAIRKIKSESGAMDTSAAADAAASRKQEVQDHIREEAEKLRAKIEQQEIQRRNMRSNRISGRS